MKESKLMEITFEMDELINLGDILKAEGRESIKGSTSVVLVKIEEYDNSSSTLFFEVEAFDNSFIEVVEEKGIREYSEMIHKILRQLFIWADIQITWYSGFDTHVDFQF